MKKITYAFFSTFLILNLIFAGSVLARPYGCGLYNAQTYDSGTCVTGSASGGSTKNKSSTTSDATSSNPFTTDSGTSPSNDGTVLNTGNNNSAATSSSNKSKTFTRAIELIMGIALVTGAIWLILWYRKRDKQIVPAPAAQQYPPVNTPTVWG